MGRGPRRERRRRRSVVVPARRRLGEPTGLPSPGHRRGSGTRPRRLAALRSQVFAHQPAKRSRYRAGYLTDGERLVWEYPRQTPDGDQMDIVEVMEIRDGLIAHHRVYWVRVGVGMLMRGAHSR